MTASLTKIIAFFFISFSLFFLLKYFLVYQESTSQNNQFSFINSTNAIAPVSTSSLSCHVVVERTGIINELGIMTDDFIVGEFDEARIKSVVVNNNMISKEKVDERKLVIFDKFKVCDESLVDFVPCLDNVGKNCNKNGKELDCLVPRPKGYKIRVPWSKSRDEVWFHNVPHTFFAEHDKDQTKILKKDDKLTFLGERAIYAYLDQISQMVPEITFGQHIRVALDIDPGVGNFGAYLMDRNVTTLAISQNDVKHNQVQLALERGVPAMVAAFETYHLPYPSQAFDLIHCSYCRVNWTHNAGIALLEANRILRAGGYFVWAAKGIDEEQLKEQWKEMEDFTIRICWELVNKEGSITIWQKSLNNSCYLNRVANVQPPLCPINDKPDDIWNITLKQCITRSPDNGYGANVTDWPARLHNPPGRLLSIKMDAYKSRRELYKADSKYWKDIVNGYIIAFHINSGKMRNIMDMKTGYGGFAAALLDFQVNSWVMNVVPVSGSNTLPLIYDRGLIGVMHDWCKPFNTYPRTYDMLHASGLFSAERKRCNISNIMLEMDRILRPDGRAYIRDTTIVIYQLKEIAKAMGWVTFMFDSEEGPHSYWKLLTCEKRL